MARIFFIVFIFSGLYAQCSEMDGMECGNDNNCEWVEDIETGNCGNLYDDDCELNPECNWNCDFVDDYMGWCNYSCDGGPYEIDNSYCQEIQMPEPPVCSDIDTEEECNHPFHGDGCEWIADIELGNCYFAWSESNCQAHDGCEWECEMIWDSSLWQDVLVCDCEGQYQVDVGYCEETQMPEPPVCSDIDTQEECDHPFHGDGCQWVEDGQVEIEDCSEFDNSENGCNDYPGECYWDEDITYGSCSGYSEASCNNYEGCFLDCSNYYGFNCNCYGTEVITNTECVGEYEINTGYCTEAYDIGDVNSDGSINVIDVVELVTIILNAEYNISGDVNQDGTNNITDIISLVNIVLGGE